MLKLLLIKEEEIKKPANYVNRIYNKVIVYNSFVSPKKDKTLSSDESQKHIILEESSIGEADISNYLNNDANAGLFLKIISSNDPDDKSYPPVGTGINVYVNIYVQSASKNFKKLITQKLSYIPDRSGDKYSTTIVPIPYKCLEGIASYDNGYAWLYVEYYTISMQTNEKTYSYVWKDIIETTLINGDN